MTTTITDIKTIPEVDLQVLQVVFDTLDEDESGFIEKEEMSKLFKEFAEELGENFKLADAEANFEAADSDGSGRVDFEEFVRHFAHYII